MYEMSKEAYNLIKQQLAEYSDHLDYDDMAAQLLATLHESGFEVVKK